MLTPALYLFGLIYLITGAWCNNGDNFTTGALMMFAWANLRDRTTRGGHKGGGE